ncbi:MAG: helix-turn-helix transcriptional regulator [Bacteroidota bacterium]
MSASLSIIEILLLIGIVQGLVTGVLLIFSKRNPRSNKYLGLALIVFSISIFKEISGFWYWDIPVLRYFPNALELAIAPLFYYYAASLVNPKFSLKRFNWLHLVPAILSQIYSTLVYFSVLGVKSLSEKDELAKSLGFWEVTTLEDYLTILSIVVYLYLCYRKIKVYRKWLNENASNTTYPDFNWMKSLLILSSIMGGLFFTTIILVNTLPTSSAPVIRVEAFYNVFVAFFIYYFGLTGYRQPHYELAQVPEQATSPKSSTLEEERKAEIIQLVNKALDEDKVYLTPTLTIQELAKHLSIPQQSLSIVINESFQKKFRDLINEYRVEDVKVKLKDPAFEQMSLLGVALESGFNSEASFYRIFKQHTGMTPKAYLKGNNTSYS